MIEAVLEEKGIPLKDYRGQGYDNGANMSGKVKGVQAEILKANPLAKYSPVHPIHSTCLVYTQLPPVLRSLHFSAQSTGSSVYSVLVQSDGPS